MPHTLRKECLKVAIPTEWSSLNIEDFSKTNSRNGSSPYFCGGSRVKSGVTMAIRELDFPTF